MLPSLGAHTLFMVNEISDVCRLHVNGIFDPELVGIRTITLSLHKR